MGFDLDNTNSQNRQAPKNLHIARGDWNDLSHINKFGFKASVGTNFETIWDGTGNYSFVATAGTIQLTSTSGSDDNTTVVVEGLDENWDIASETLTVAGPRGTTRFIRVHRAYVDTPATGLANVGDITILHTQDDSTDTTIAKILAGNGQTLMAVYSVPRNKRAYIYKFQGSLEKNKECVFQGRARLFGKGFNVKGQWGSSGTPVTYDYPVPLQFPQKTDFEVRVKAGATTGAGAIFDLILEDFRY